MEISNMILDGHIHILNHSEDPSGFLMELRHAEDQIVMAAEKSIMGFKVICDRYFPGDKRAMEIFRIIAKTKRPILFHSGILWDGKPSSQYNRPSEFESLLEINHLRFSLAHISWPWCDELIAVYEKFLNAYAGNLKRFVGISSEKLNKKIPKPGKQ